MSTKSRIGSGQLFCLLFLSSAFSVLSLPGTFAESLPQTAPICFLLSALPVWLAARFRSKHEDGLLSCAQFTFPAPLAVAIALFYLLYFLFSASVSAAQYHTFLRSELLPNSHPFWILLFLCAAGTYAAWAGLEAFARTVVFLCVGAIPVFLLLFLLLAGRIDLLNYEPLPHSSPLNLLISGAQLTALLPETALIFLLAPLTRPSRRGLWYWIPGAFLLFFCTGLWITGVLGSLAPHLSFPFYSLAELAEFGKLQRWDSFCLAVWSFSAFTRITLLLYCAGACVHSFRGRRAAQKSIFAGGAAVCVAGTLLAEHSEWFRALYPTAFSAFALLLCLLFPVWILLRTRKKHRPSE